MKSCTVLLFIPAPNSPMNKSKPRAEEIIFFSITIDFKDTVLNKLMGSQQDPIWNGDP